MSVETLDQTSAMRLLTDTELAEVNGGFITFDDAILLGFLLGYGLTVLIGGGGGGSPGDVYWPAA